MAPIKLIYFSLPGRAEVARLLLHIGKVEHEDNRVTFEEWGAIKPTVPFGQLPCLDVDGKILAQSAAIDRFCAAKAGLLPSDPWQVALADQAYFFCEDVWQTLYPTMKIKDAGEKVKAFEELLAPEGALTAKLNLMAKLVEGRPGKFLTGDEITHGDLAVFCNLSLMQCGWLQMQCGALRLEHGVPRDVLDRWPALKAFRHSIASLPEIAAFYAKESDDLRINGFRA